MGGFIELGLSADEIGKLIGTLFWAGIAILGTAKCFRISKREQTSRLCVHGLALTLIALIILQFPTVVDLVVIEGPVQLVLKMLAIAGAVFCFLSGFIVAVVGLSLYRRSFSPEGRRLEFTQGKKQAVWAIVLSSFFSLMIMGSVIAGIAKKGQFSRAQQLAPPPHDGEYLFEEFNFRLSVPDEDWVSIDPKTANEAACLVLRRRNPEIYMAVIAEQAGVELDMSLKQLVDISRTNIEVVSPTASFTDPAALELNGFPGESFEVDARVGAMDFSYRYWCGARNGYCYQVLFWSAARHKEQMIKLSASVLDGFEQAVPEKRVYSSGNGPYGKVESEVFGYSLELEGTDWMRWNGLRESDEFADSGGVKPDGTRFTITPIALIETNVPLHLVQQAAVELYGFDGPLKGEKTTVETGGLSGLAYAYENGKNSCVERVLAAPNIAYLISVWQAKEESNNLEQQALQVFDAISFEPAAFKLELLDELPQERQTAQAQSMNRVGLAYYNAGQPADAYEWFAAGFRYNPTNATYFGNMLAACNELGRRQEALNLIAKAPPEVCAAEGVRIWNASLLKSVGRIAEADALYTQAFGAGYRDDDDFMTWTRMRAENGQWDGLDALFQSYTGAAPSQSLLIHQMDLYYQKGDYEKVAALAQGYLDQQGFSPDIAYWLIDAQQDLGHYKEALETADELIGRGYATVSAYQEKAYCEYRLNWYRPAKETLQTALKLNPDNETTKDWLGIISAELGEGDNSCLEEAIDPVRLPTEFEKQFSRSVPAGFGELFGAYYSQHLTLWHFEKEKDLRKTIYYSATMLDDAGVSSFSSLEYGFDPVSESIFVNKLLVKDADGKVVAQGAVRDYYVMDDDSSGLVTEDKKLVIPVPSLRPGYTIEAEVTIAQNSPPEKFSFDRDFLASSFPRLESGVFYGGDVEDIMISGFNGVDVLKGADGTLVKLKEPYVYKWEPVQSFVEEFVPGVDACSPDESWASAAETYLELIREKLLCGTPVKEKAVELSRGLESDEEKYAAVIGWIRAAFTYKPLEFGRSAYIPDLAEDTLSYRYGDCKDLAVLLKAMLESIGIDCSLVLVNSGDPVRVEMPSTDQFNHVIAYLPTIRGGLFVDPTDQDVSAFLAVPTGLKEAHVLIVDEEAPKLVTIGNYAADSSSCRVERRVQLGADTADIEESVRMRGYYASWMRGFLKGRQKVQWIEWFQENMGSEVYQGLEIVSVSAENITDPEQDLILSITSRKRIPQPGSVSLPPTWVKYYLPSQRVWERRNPFEIDYPLTLEISTSIEGSGAAAAFRADSASGPHLDWSTDGKGAFKCVLKQGKFPAQDYDAMIDAVNAGIDAAYVNAAVEDGL